MKINKEISSYIIFGVLTTIVNILTYALLTKVFGFGYQFATATAWFTAVLFAYYTNKKYVFKFSDIGLVKASKYFLLFSYYRILSLIIDVVIMYVLIDILLMNDLVTKIIANIIVVAINYMTSKVFVFKKENTAN